MSKTVKAIRKELEQLSREGRDMLIKSLDRQGEGKVRKPQGSKEEQYAAARDRRVEYLRRREPYKSWYTRALPVVRQLLPERYEEFQEQYRQDKREEFSPLTYTISDYFLGFNQKNALKGKETFDIESAFYPPATSTGTVIAERKATPARPR